MRNKPTLGILAGLLTVTLWASLPLLRSLIELPPMLTATIAMVSAAMLAQVLGRRGSKSSVPSAACDMKFWVMGVGGLTGALYFYFLALGNGDPAKVTLVTYTWPVGLMLVSDKLEGRGLQIQTLLGALIAFSGLMPLILTSGESEPTPPLAYGAGLAAGISWVVFSLYLKGESQSQRPDFKRIFGGVACVSLCLHLFLEPAAKNINQWDWLLASLIGFGPYGLAFMTWGYALLTCSTTLLGILTYLVPVFSSLFVVVLGWAPMNAPLLVALVAIFASGVITQTSSSLFNLTSRGDHRSDESVLSSQQGTR
ncbi:DMT family transporter [Halomonas sp. G11]|uniref:DMT family transporter n=1 Tax=Halomonas sp. G11 TaxID=1684425 RepID=UPI0007FB99AE|nr:DMT family transporter [Halomonas sp. G11]OBA00749.1 hypothetical protein ADS46_00060 [Halomonas sp. G11]